MSTTLSKKQTEFCRAFVRTRNRKEAAHAAGIVLFPERAAEKLLASKPVQAKIQALEEEMRVRRAELIAGYRRLAFGSVADPIRLLLATDTGEVLDPDSLDLFSVSEIKKPKGGGLEIKFFDRQKALEQLALLEEAPMNSALPFYAALEQSAQAFQNRGDTPCR